MGFINFIAKLLKNNQPEPEENNGSDNINYPEQYIKTLAFNNRIKTLLSEDRFIARSDYKNLIQEYQDLISFYHTLKESGLFKEYLFKNHLDNSEIEFFNQIYREIKNLAVESPTIHEHNQDYIKKHLESEKQYLDDILKVCDPNILLDNEQREVVLSEEDHTLVIAGAGAGKTTTIAAKIRYLVEKRGIKPQDILVISFTNKAVEELRDRINNKLKIDCPVTTFHSTGYAILKQYDNDRKRIVEGSFMYRVINDYLKSQVLNNTDLVNKLVLFFGSYFTAPYEGNDLNEYFQFVSKADFSTLKGNVHEYVQKIIDRKTKQVQTLNNEVLRSMEEVRIANFLYMHQIEYEYEPIYKYRIIDANKPYTPDFVIKQGEKTTYIEHFGITEDGRNNLYDQATLDLYKSRINDKILLHRKHKTDLIYTFSKYNDGRSYIDHLSDKLIQRGYELNMRSTEEVYKKLVTTEEGRYITRLTLLLCTFIGNFKTQGYKLEKFEEFRNTTKNVRTKLFLDICMACYLEYQKALDEGNSIDFEDMINQSADVIRKRQQDNDPLQYKYIIVDEYQDISRQRYNLIRELSKLCNAKIIAVGDDWQSIYAFSGSILPLFTRFCNEVGYGEELKITRTYRNAQEIIDIAGTFVQKNSAQIRKQLISPKHITNPVIIHSYAGNYGDKNTKGQGGIFFNIGNTLNDIIGDIIENNKKESGNKIPSILMIGRYGFDFRDLCHSNQFNYDEHTGNVYSTKYGTNVKLQFMTAHSSKGLSAENVIIVNAKDTLYGFPSRIDDDPVLNLVVENDTSYNYAEERRLFYVALTRTKNRVYIITPEKRPSIFIKELLSDQKSYPNVTLRGNLDCNMSITNEIKNRCPVCGYPLQLKWNKNYGLRLWICTNDQEVCGFMSNDRRGGKLSIEKCDCCQDGYLVVKNNGNHFFLGCTNYKKDRSGCNRTLDWGQYTHWKNNELVEDDQFKNKPAFWLKEQTEIINNTVPEVPKPIKETPKTKDKPIIKEEEKKKTQRGAVHSVEHKEFFIEKDGFYVLVDEDGNLLTDMELLKKLRTRRNELAKEKEIQAFMVFRNKDLVYLATDKPTTHQEFVAIKGISELKYKLYGEQIIDVIKNHIE